jgi:hypothetical protein
MSGTSNLASCMTDKAILREKEICYWFPRRKCNLDYDDVFLRLLRRSLLLTRKQREGSD